MQFLLMWCHDDDCRSAANTAVLFSLGDFIGCWDSKFYYNFWRPVTAIHAGDTDDNDATEADTFWEPLATTRNHPRAWLLHRSRGELD